MAGDENLIINFLWPYYNKYFKHIQCVCTYKGIRLSSRNYKIYTFKNRFTERKKEEIQMPCMLGKNLSIQHFQIFFLFLPVNTGRH